jgi:ABC-type amino acid transport system permease subunit
MLGIIGGIVLGVAGFLAIHGTPMAHRSDVSVQIVAGVLFILAILSVFYGVYSLGQRK